MANRVIWRVIWRVIALVGPPLMVLMSMGYVGGCGQTGISNVKVDNPALSEAWEKYESASQAGVDQAQLERIERNITRMEESLKKYYLETGNMRDEKTEKALDNLIVELQRLIDNAQALEEKEGIPPLELERLFGQIQETLTPDLTEESYIYVIAISRTDPQWALVWLDVKRDDLVVEGPALALQRVGDTWTIKSFGYDTEQLAGLPRDLVRQERSYLWMSDTAWVVTQVQDYMNSNYPGEPYRLKRFKFGDKGDDAYVFIMMKGKSLGFGFRKTPKLGWYLSEEYAYPPEE